MKKGAIEFTTRQIIILIIMILIATCVIFLGISYSEQIKELINMFLNIKPIS